MNVLILEDDKKILDTIKEHVADTLDCTRIDTCQSIAQAEYFLQRNVYDFISLDVNLPDGNGLDLAKSIRESNNNNNAYLFIITGNPSLEIAFKAYDQTRCFKFLHKPFTRTKLIEAFTLLKETITSNPNLNYFTYQSRTLLIKIPTREILYFEIVYKECHIKTISDRITINRYTIKEILNNTKDYNFIQIHRSYVINLNQVIGIEIVNKKWVCLIKNSDEKLLIGKKYLLPLKEKFKELS